MGIGSTRWFAARRRVGGQARRRGCAVVRVSRACGGWRLSRRRWRCGPCGIEVGEYGKGDATPGECLRLPQLAGQQAHDDRVDVAAVDELIPAQAPLFAEAHLLVDHDAARVEVEDVQRDAP